METRSYKDLDKKLRAINNERNIDLFQRRMKIRKEIDGFYQGTVSPNKMMSRSDRLKMSINSRDMLLIPILITIAYGFLVNYVYTMLKEGPLSSFDVVTPASKLISFAQQHGGILANGWVLTKSLGLLALLFVLVVLLIGSMFYLAFPFLFMVTDITRDTRYQKEYELEVLQKVIEDAMKKYMDEAPSEYQREIYVPIAVRLTKKHRIIVPLIVVAVIGIITRLLSGDFIGLMGMFFFGGFCHYLYMKAVNKPEDEKIEKKQDSTAMKPTSALPESEEAEEEQDSAIMKSTPTPPESEIAEEEPTDNTEKSE